MRQSPSIDRLRFARKRPQKSLLDAFVNSTNSLTTLLSIKNAQMEAESEEEIEVYRKNLNKAILYVVNEIKNERPFESELQLFQLFRLVSPEAHAIHPNRYRDALVQVGAHMCPSPEKLYNLVSEIFFNMGRISHPLIRAIYFHHELIRIHPFVDGNGRITRIAKNWILMYNLYPPIFIRDEVEKKKYISALSKSFKAIGENHQEWHEETNTFFIQELNRVTTSIQYILEEIRAQ